MAKNKFVIGAALGGIFGAVGGFLAGTFASSKKGEQVREDVARETKTVVDKAEVQVRKVAKKVSDSGFKDTVKTEGKKAVQEIKKAWNTAGQQPANKSAKKSTKKAAKK